MRGFSDTLRDITNRAHSRPTSSKQELSEEELLDAEVSRIIRKAKSDLYVLAELGNNSGRVYVAQGCKVLSDFYWELATRVRKQLEDEGFDTKKVVSVGNPGAGDMINDIYLIVSW